MPQVKQEHFRFFVTTVEQNPLGFTEFVERCRQRSFPENFVEYLGFVEGDFFLYHHSKPPFNPPFGKTYCMYFFQASRSSLSQIQGATRWKRTASRKQIDPYVPARDVTPWSERSVSPENVFSSLDVV